MAVGVPPKTPQESLGVYPKGDGGGAADKA
jgi:hypothetical protein